MLTRLIQVAESNRSWNLAILGEVWGKPVWVLPIDVRLHGIQTECGENRDPELNLGVSQDRRLEREASALKSSKADGSWTMGVRREVTDSWNANVGLKLSTGLVAARR